jgi:hypothetical protein
MFKSIKFLAAASILLAAGNAVACQYSLAAFLNTTSMEMPAAYPEGFGVTFQGTPANIPVNWTLNGSYPQSGNAGNQPIYSNQTYDGSYFSVAMKVSYNNVNIGTVAVSTGVCESNHVNYNFTNTLPADSGFTATATEIDGSIPSIVLNIVYDPRPAAK